MTLEELNDELGAILDQIGEASTEQERITLEDQYETQVASILEQIEQIENGTA